MAGLGEIQVTLIILKYVPRIQIEYRDLFFHRDYYFSAECGIYHAIRFDESRH